MKILVTGAGGMIGRKLVERLAKDKTLGGKTIELAPALKGNAIHGDLCPAHCNCVRRDSE